MLKDNSFKDRPIKDSLIKNGVMLGAFAIVTTALIAVTFFGTKDTIEEQKRRKLLSVLNEAVPSFLHTNPLYADCTVIDSPALGPGNHTIYRARLNNQPAGLVVQARAPDGYSGNIDMVIGVDTQLNVLGVRVVEHKETPGLGDKVELAISDWITTFAGKEFSSDNLAPWQVKKDGGEFDQFTGATITPRAVVNAVKNALIYVAENQTSLFDASNQCQTDADMNTNSQEQPS